MTGVARTYGVALSGLAGTVVEVEAAVSSELPGLVLIGLPDAALGEARDRVRSAASSIGCPLPSRKVTVNLSPAALPKHGSGFDLAIALAALAAGGSIRPETIERTIHLGELGLDGRLRPVPGILPAVVAAQRAGWIRVIVPEACRAEAELVDGIEVVGAASLAGVLRLHGAAGAFVDPEDAGVPLALETVSPVREPEPDVADVVGNREAVRALTVAAAGAHHLLLLGPPGAGKTMLAARLPGLLPDLDVDRALEVSSIRSLSGAGLVTGLIRRPPFEAPHHTATAASIIGGGSGQIRPGAAARASDGVLFLDEAPEFSPSVLDCLRQPLESGRVTVHRARATAEYPARFQLVLAANPCPCGNDGVGEQVCTCAPAARRRYLARLSGPLTDRIDIRLTVRRVTSIHQAVQQGSPSTSVELRTAVAAARTRARERLAGTPWRVNAEVSGTWLRDASRRPDESVRRPLDRALERGALTMRGYDRVMRLSWTLADLAGLDRPGADELGEALVLRGGLAA